MKGLHHQKGLWPRGWEPLTHRLCLTKIWVYFGKVHLEDSFLWYCIKVEILDGAFVLQTVWDSGWSHWGRHGVFYKPEVWVLILRYDLTVLSVSSLCVKQGWELHSSGVLWRPGAGDGQGSRALRSHLGSRGVSHSRGRRLPVFSLTGTSHFCRFSCVDERKLGAAVARVSTAPFSSSAVWLFYFPSWLYQEHAVGVAVTNILSGSSDAHHLLLSWRLFRSSLTILASSRKDFQQSIKFDFFFFGIRVFFLGLFHFIILFFHFIIFSLPLFPLQGIKKEFAFFQA